METIDAAEGIARRRTSRETKRSAAVAETKKLLDSLPKTPAEDQIRSTPPIDIQQIFLLYCTFCGDLERTAHAAQITAVDVVRLANENGWQQKIEPIIKLKNSNSPGDIERAINRATNFVQAHRMRLILDRMVRRFAMMEEDELLSHCISVIRTTHKNGDVSEETRVATRPFADLSSAIEKVHAMTYMALNDTNMERTRRAAAKEDVGASELEIHSSIAAQMSKVTKEGPTTPRGALVEGQAEQAANLIQDVESIVRTVGPSTAGAATQLR